jgi:hypothetical protein
MSSLSRAGKVPRPRKIDALFVAENAELFFDRFARADLDIVGRKAVTFDEVRHQPRVPGFPGPLERDRFADDRVVQGLSEGRNHNPSLPLHCFCDSQNGIARCWFVRDMAVDESTAEKVAVFGSSDFHGAIVCDVGHSLLRPIAPLCRSRR